MKIKITISFVLLFAVICQGSSAKGPLVVHPENPRYFMVKGDPEKKAVYLTGSHTHFVFQDEKLTNLKTVNYDQDCSLSEKDTNYLPWNDCYLDFLQYYGHNFTRGWVWEQACWAPWTKEDVRYSPVIYQRTGPGKARDGEPKFDLTKFNQEYFDRLRERIIAASKRGIYVSVMLFEGWSIERKAKKGREHERGNPWLGHPFNRDNNINDIDGDPNQDDEGKETHTLALPEVTRLQEIYVKKVIDELNNLDNILWEISNESHKDSAPWHYHIINFIKKYEKTKPKQHLIGMTGYVLNNQELFESPADWISPNKKSPTHKEGYRHNPPDAEGKKIIISDTDHLWGFGGNHSWVWRSFTRGMHPIYMDPLCGRWDVTEKRSILLRHALGHTLRFAGKVDLARMTPRNDLSSTKFCLANPGKEYVIYQPAKKAFNLKLSTGSYYYEWFDPQAGKVLKTGKIIIKTTEQNFTPLPSCVYDSVLYLKKVK
ncbi:MAG: hypothetical protein JSV03_03740 [Planctomycetota bacterium]|nr:MAG: hypothetical protein JSV03_03740 [Planctomycetota bacterium]